MIKVLEEFSMKPADRQKMCPNCDGRIPYDVGQCPYCFATIQTEALASTSHAAPSSHKNQSIQDSLTSLYAPPYAAKASSAENERTSSMKYVDKEVAAAAPREGAQEEPDTKAFWPILCLTLAGNLFTLGVLQFFFSEEGLVRLEMSGSYWFLFILLSLPLLYLGLKQANQSK